MASKQDLAPDWSGVPDWVAYVAIDASGTVFGFEGEPYPQRDIPAWYVKKSDRHSGLRKILEMGIVEIPSDVKWQDLCWKRPLNDNAANP